MPTIINPLPYVFVNGTTIDATQMDADLGQIVSNVNVLGTTAGAALVGATATTNNLGATIQAQLNNVGGAAGATNVGYSPPGTGAVTTTVGARLNQTIVLDAGYGADPTGVADNSAAFTKALSALLNGGTIKFPPGVFFFSSTLQWTQNNIWVEGSGIGATILQFGAATSSVDLVVIGSAVASTVHCGLSQLSINSTVLKSNGAAVHVVNAQSIRLRYLDIQLNMYIGFDFEGGANQLFYYLDDFEIHSGPIAILIGADAQVQELRINNGIVAGGTDSGIKFVSASGIYLSQLAVAGAVGMRFVPGNGQKVKAIFGNAVIVDSCVNHAWSFEPTGTGIVEQSAFVDCWGCTTSAGEGLIVQNPGTTHGINFVNFKAVNNYAAGINLAGGSYLTFSNCEIAQNSQAGSGTYHGLYANNCSLFSIIGGTFGASNSISSNKQGYGIAIDTGCAAFSIIGAVCNGNATGNILDAATSTAKNICKNYGYNPRPSTGISTAGGSPVTWTNNTGDSALLSWTGGTITNVTVAGLVVSVAINGAVMVPQAQTAVITYPGAAPTLNYLGT